MSHFKVKHWKINKIPFLGDLPTSQVTPVMVKSAKNEALAEIDRTKDFF